MTNARAQRKPPDQQPTPSGPDRPSLLERQEQLQASPGYRAMALKDRVKHMGYVFQGNVAQYKSFVAGLQDPAISLPIMDVRNPDAHDQLLSEAERLLHNVLTAMSTRVDQQRVFMKKHFRNDAVLTKEYDDKVASAFIADPLATFLKGLRNYITHDELPVAQSKQTLGPQSFAITFTLPCSPMLRWDTWSRDMKAWIAGWGEAVAIVDVVDSYAHTAGGFDRWLFDRIGLKYAAEIDAFLREQEELSRDAERVFGL